MEQRFLQENYIDNLDGIAQVRVITADSSYNYGDYPGANQDLRFNNIPLQRGFLKEAKVMAVVNIVDANGVIVDNATSSKLNVSLTDTLKCYVNRCEIQLNGTPIVSQSLLQNYFSIKEQLKSEPNEEALDFHSTYYPSQQNYSECSVAFDASGALNIAGGLGETITFPDQQISCFFIGDNLIVGQTAVATSSGGTFTGVLTYNAFLPITVVGGLPVVQLPAIAANTITVYKADGSGELITTAVAARANVNVSGHFSGSMATEYDVALQEIIGERTKRAFKLHTAPYAVGQEVIQQPLHRHELFSMRDVLIKKRQPIPMFMLQNLQLYLRLDSTGLIGP